jgi:hypothetical protein
MRSDGVREELEHEADVARARLLGTIDELDRRRHQLLDWRLQIRRHVGDIMSAVGGLFIGVGATAIALAFEGHRRQRNLRRERARAAVRLWQHPERVASRGSAVAGILRIALVALVAMATTALGSRQIDRLRKRPRLPAYPREPLGV